ncbi:MAG: glycoside hydrolase family 3 C-terminal domain-containing protein [Lachnospiraceae bacterium]|nr:glycoside hydrolase family 3 C-terminal domain-containing protein [Lachnospiraceae bacterium]
METKKRFAAKAMSGLFASTMALSLCVTPLVASANMEDLLDKEKTYTTDYESFAAEIQAAAELNKQIEAEGVVMLKNSTPGKAPFSQEDKITVLGRYSTSPSYGGAGSGSSKLPGSGLVGEEYIRQTPADVFAGLEQGGLSYNEAVKNIYLELGKVNFEDGVYMEQAEDGDAEYAGVMYKDAAEGTLAAAESTYEEYNNAVLVFARSGQEGRDNGAYNVGQGHSDITDHVLELNDNERAMVAYAKKHFDKVVIILNSPNAMEVGDLQKDDEITAIYWIGQPGWNGFEVIGDVLTGKINPSGKLVDEWFSKFEYDPTWYNFGNYAQAQNTIEGSTEIAETKTIAMYLDPAASITTNKNDFAIDYAEGIYLGYRYVETVYEALGEEGDAWIEEVLTYPFGYGLSYTTFDQKIKAVEGDLSDPEGKLKVTVTVANTGSVPGKEVVQLYVSKPYTTDGIEKAAIDLVGFGKTGELAPGMNEDVEIEIEVKDLASFDYNDANENGHCGYELEAGSYILSVRYDSHVVADSAELIAENAFDYEEDDDENTPNNIYSQKDNAWELYNTLSSNWTVSGENHYMTRGTTDEDSTNLSILDFAKASHDIMGEDEDAKEAAAEQLKKLSWLLYEDNNFTEAAINARHSQEGTKDDPWGDTDNRLTVDVETDYENVWLRSYDDIPAEWTQATEIGEDRIQLYTLLGEPMYLEDGSENPLWTEFMNQLTYTEMLLFIGNDNTHSMAAIDSVGKPLVYYPNGPSQIDKGMAWACPVVVASTWNAELAYEQGLRFGDESMWQERANKGMDNGWYGPALDNHRNPLAGRNFEYFSQDGVQGGIIAAMVIKGAVDKGVHVTAKHAIMNDQETNRFGTSTFVTEQAFRDIYAKSFELTVKLGNCNGFMSAFNSIGLASSSAYATAIQLYENEWGFDGFSQTDMHQRESSYGDASMWSASILARGHNTPLGNVNEDYKNGIPNADMGIWDASLRDGKGSVLIKGSAEAAAEDTESPTQWYWVRTTAMRIMYVTANGNAMRNGFTLNMLTPAAIQGKNGDEITIENVVNTAAIDMFLGDGYTVTVEGLPAGLTFDAEANTITGKIEAEAGEGNYTVTVQAKDAEGAETYLNWIHLSQNAPFVIEGEKPAETAAAE